MPQNIFFPLLDKILSVRKGEIIFEFESDKVIYEVEAPEAGILGSKFNFEGEKLSVGTLVAYLAPLEPDPSTY